MVDVASTTEAFVTYTKDGHKKKGRKWIDGKISINLASRQAVLYSEDGEVVISGCKVPNDVHISDDSDEFSLDTNLLVVITEVTSTSKDADARKPDLNNENIENKKLGSLPSPNDFKGFVRGSDSSLEPLRTTISTVLGAYRQPRSAAEILKLLTGEGGMNGTPEGEERVVNEGTWEGASGKNSKFIERYSKRPRLQKEAEAPRIPNNTVILKPTDDQPARVSAGASAIAQREATKVGMAWPQRIPKIGQSERTSSAVGINPPPPGSIYFPRLEEANEGPSRRVCIPTSFPNASSYQRAWMDSLKEEMTLRIFSETAKPFFAVLDKMQTAGGSGVHSPAAIEAAMRKAHVSYYAFCDVFIWKNKPGGQSCTFPGGKRKRKKTADNDDGDVNEDPNSPAKSQNVYLILKSGRERSREYSKGGLWLTSIDPLFGHSGRKDNSHWVAVARSLWHGPNQDGKFEIEFLSAPPAGLGRSTPVYAIKGPDASTELSILDFLDNSSMVREVPLTPYLLSYIRPMLETSIQAHHRIPPVIVETVKDGEYIGDVRMMTPIEHAEAIIRRSSLNPEQAGVVRHVASWASGFEKEASGDTDVTMPPVCLIFGPFGCGKSSLLVAILHFILAVRSEGGLHRLTGARVLVSAHTNVAVDRVLLSLLDSGCTDFLRVGPLRRIDRRLLAHSLHATESRTCATAVAELREMLREAAGNPQEEAVLRGELAAAERGADRQRKKLLKTVPIVGVTCCSSMLPTLDGLSFDIVLLDESSQMIEPLSMVPILRSKAKYLIAAGDPRQLPPVITSPTLVTVPPTNSSGGGIPPEGLLRPLFVRLSTMGYSPHFLRRQYRCHPAIAAVPNAHFYGGRLLDGCNASQRPSCLPGLPPVVCIDVRHGSEERRCGSICNEAEAAVASNVALRALEAGVRPGRCGVICFYRAQAAAVRGHLDRLVQQGAAGFDLKSVHVGTVDAFQGAEKDVIVLTTAFTRPGAFASDACRLNVGLTRAKHNLVVIGCMPALEQASPAFAALLNYAKRMPGGCQSGHLPELRPNASPRPQRQGEEQSGTMCAPKPQHDA